MTITRGIKKSTYFDKTERKQIEQYSKKKSLSFSQSKRELIRRGFNEWVLTELILEEK